MKEFFITIGFILLFLGVPILLACIPFFLRDAARRRDRKRRHRNLEKEKGAVVAEGQVFEVTIRFNKEELKQVVALEDRQDHPIVLSSLASLVLLMWVIGGSIGIREMLVGEEPSTVWRWLRNLFGVLVGSWLLYVIWFQARVQRNRIDEASEYEVSQVTERKYFIDSNGLKLSMEGEEVAEIEWDQVDHLVEEPDALCLMLVSRDFLWIPKDSLFQQGDWESLKAMLQPLKKGKYDV